MGKIYDSMIPNTFGEGHEQIMELNGKTYKISNSIVPNTFGDGCEKNIEEISSNDYSPAFYANPSKLGSLISNITLGIFVIWELLVIGVGIWFMFLVISAMFR